MGFFDFYKKKRMNLGGSIVSKNILSGKGTLTWCIRENGMNPNDNGWRFFSNIDDSMYLSNPANMAICAWDTVVEIEPAILAIFDCPVGTELLLVEKDGRKMFINPDTEEEVKFY